MPTSIVYLYPDSISVDSAAFVLTGAPTKPEALDDPQGAPDDDASYLECTTSLAGVEQISIGFQPMPDVVSVVNVDVEFRSKKVSGSGNQQTFINGGSVGAHILDTIYTDYSDAFATDPFTGIEWSKAGVDSATVTLIQDATVMVARLTGMRLKVECVPSAALIGAATDVGSRIGRLGRRAIMLPRLEGPLLWADLDLYSDFGFTFDRYPTAHVPGAGWRIWERAALRVLESEVDLDSLTVKIAPMDLRHYLVRFWDTAISEVAANATSPGSMRLDPGVGRSFFRSSKAWVENSEIASQGSKEIIQIGADVEKTEPLGLLIEEERTNDILNSTFSLGVATSWTVTGNVVDGVGDLLFSADISAQSAAFQRIGTGSANLAQAVAYSGSEVLTLSLWHRDDSDVALRWSAQRSTDSFYWNESTLAWQAGAVENLFPVSAVNTRHSSAPIVLSAGAQTVTFKFLAESISDQVNHGFGIQVEEGRFATSFIVTGPSAVPRWSDELLIENDSAEGPVWWPTQGSGRVAFTPLFSTDALLPDAVLLDVTDDVDVWDRILYRNSTGMMVFERNTGVEIFAAEIAVALVAGLTYQVSWAYTGEELEYNREAFTLSVYVDGVKGTDAVSDTGCAGGAFMRIGSKQDTGDLEHFANGHLSHITTTSVVMSSEEMLDWR